MPMIPDLPGRDGAEPVYVVLGGIPYPALILPVNGLPHGVQLAELQEDVGDPECITRDFASTHFGAGSMLPCVDTRGRHVSDGRRLMEPRAVTTA